MSLALAAYRAGATAWGRVLPRTWAQPAPAPARKADVWVHGASAGEVRAALAVRQVAQELGGGEGWLVTASTRAGLAVGAHARLCRDVPQQVTRALDAVAPRALVLVEAELWPNLLMEARRRGLPVGVLGARMSERSAARWARSPKAAANLLGAVTAFAAASEGDAARLLALGAPAEAVRATGWIKWPSASAAAPRGRGGRPTLVLGCVHPGEVQLAARRLARTELAPGSARWIVVPRHSRAHARLRVEAATFLPAGTWELEGRFGVLPTLYASSDFALVGGGGTGRASHNLLEPLAAGLRPLFFPDRPDPAGIGERLWGAGLARSLGAAGPSSPPGDHEPLSWDDVLTRWDGRRESLQFLHSRGVDVLL